MEITEDLRRKLLIMQRNECTESIVYERLAKIEKHENNRNVLQRIAAEERMHYSVLRKYTGQDVSPNRSRVARYYWMARLFGITFAVKLMERGEENAHINYGRYEELEDLKKISEDEEAHEQALIGLIDEERLAYTGSVVLGLNDALVEFTGVLAGFTLALSNSGLIALTGAITGIAAALSMASSEYLSTKTDTADGKHPGKAAFYTGVAYLLTVVLLVGPYALFNNVFVALAIMLFLALMIILVFNYYYSVACDQNFKRRFTEMAVLSFSVAALSFVIGYILQQATGISA